MVDENLEEKMKAQAKPEATQEAPTEKAKPAQPTTLDKIVSAAWEGVKTLASKAVKYPLFAGTTLATYLTFGPSALITEGAFMAGEYLVRKKNKEKVKLNDIKNSGYVGLGLGIFLQGFFKGLEYIRTFTGSIAYNLASFIPFVGLNLGLDHFVKKYTPSKLFRKINDEGIYKTVKEAYTETIRPNYAEALKGSLTYGYGIIPIAVCANSLAPYSLLYKMAGSAAISTTYKIATTKPEPKLSEEENQLAGALPPEAQKKLAKMPLEKQKEVISQLKKAA